MLIKKRNRQILPVPPPPDTVTFGYDHPVWKDVLTSYNGEPVTYDAMGNITSLGDYSYTWTGGRQLKSVTSEDLHFEYFYNADGKLEKYDMYDVVTSHTADGERVETVRYSGTMYYFWNEDSLVSMCLEEDGQLLYNSRIIYDADGEAMGMCLNDSGTFLYQKDLQGDIVALITPNGQIVLEYIYDSYGNFNMNTPDNSVGSAILAMFILALNPLSYRGYLYAPGIGISYYLGSRFYSPEICRFMNADVYQDTGTGVIGTNMFAYCNNNPVSFVDPNGTSPIGIVLIVIATALVAYTGAYNSLLCLRLYQWGFTHRTKNKHYDFSKNGDKNWSNFISKRLKDSYAIKQVLKDNITNIKTIIFPPFSTTFSDFEFYAYGNKPGLYDYDLALSIGGVESSLTISAIRIYNGKTKDKNKYRVSVTLNKESFNFEDWTKEGVHTNNVIAVTLNQLGYFTQDKKLFVEYTWGFTVSFNITYGEIMQ